MRYLACLITCIAILGGQEIVKACFIHSPLPVELIEDHIPALGHGKDRRIPPQCLYFGVSGQRPEPGIPRKIIPLDGCFLSQVRNDFMGCASLKERQIREIDISLGDRTFLTHGSPPL